MKNNGKPFTVGDKVYDIRQEKFGVITSFINDSEVFVKVSKQVTIISKVADLRKSE